MKELIQITRNTIDGAEVNSVNINDLVIAIDIKTHASQWFQRQVAKYGFVENEDYLVLKNEKQTPSGIKHTVDYIVTLDTAKELAMVANTIKGREARKYFISVEKQAMSQIAIPQNPMDALALFFDVSKEQDTRITKLEQTKRLENWQEKSLKDAVSVRAYAIAEQYPLENIKVSSLHRKIWSLFKKRFFLPRYNELPAIKFQEGLQFVNSLSFADMV